jgi:hypothetical protein
LSLFLFVTLPFCHFSFPSSPFCRFLFVIIMKTSVLLASVLGGCTLAQNSQNQNTAGTNAINPCAKLSALYDQLSEAGAGE